MKTESQIKQNLIIYFRREYHDRVRAWRSDWYGDQFEILTEQELEILKKFLRVEEALDVD